MSEPFNFLENLTDEQVSQKEKRFYDSHKNLELTETPFKTQYGRKVYKDQYGAKHSESSRTIQDSQGRWMNVPTIYNGEYVNDRLAGEIIENNDYIDPETNEQIKTFETLKDAEKEAVKRNRSLNKSDQPWNEDNMKLNKRETKNTLPGHRKIEVLPHEYDFLVGKFGEPRRNKKSGLQAFQPPGYADMTGTHSGKTETKAERKQGMGSTGTLKSRDNKEYFQNVDRWASRMQDFNKKNTNLGDQGRAGGYGGKSVPPIPGTTITPGGGGGVGGVNIPNPLADQGSTSQTFAGPGSQTRLDTPVEKLQNKVMTGAMDIMDKPHEKYDPDKRFEGQSEDTKQSFEDVRKMQGTGQEAFADAAGVGQRISGQDIDPITGQSFLTGQGVDQYMSPHTDKVISGMQDQAMRTMQKQRGALQAQHQMAGAGMGSRGALENAAMMGQVQQDLGQRVSGALEGSYAQAAQMKQADMEREQQRQRYNQLAAGEEGKLQLAGADTQIRGTEAGRGAAAEDIDLLGRSGAAQEGYGQRDKDFAYDQWLEGRDWDKENLMVASNVLGGAPSGATTTSSRPMHKKKDRWGRAIAGAGAGSAFGPWGAAAGGAIGFLS